MPLYFTLFNYGVIPPEFELELFSQLWKSLLLGRGKDVDQENGIETYLNVWRNIPGSAHMVAVEDRSSLCCASLGRVL